MKLQVIHSQLFTSSNSPFTIHHSPLIIRLFGLKIAGMIMIYGTENKYSYNGKELIDDFDLNWYHYGARYYDPTLGRWHGIIGKYLRLNTFALLYFPGRAQIESGTSTNPEWRKGLFYMKAPYGDDPKDQYWIKEGFKWWGK